MNASGSAGPYVVTFLLGLGWGGYLMAVVLRRTPRAPAVKVGALGPVAEPKHSGVRVLTAREVECRS